ncbi:MAG: DUF4252 domain-containing protein [Bacteroidota bacterium]|nr:DUF4252 domain-containing protein [Bacteroidota bacterium]
MALIVMMLFVSCKDETSLQQYFVKNSENPEFISFTFSPKHYVKERGIKLKDDAFFKQIKSVNILFLNKEDSLMVNKEYTHLKAILEDEQYQGLMSFNHQGFRVQIDYVGTDQDIKEVVVLANKSTAHVAVLRIITNTLKIEQLTDIANLVQYKLSEEDFTLEDWLY